MKLNFQYEVLGLSGKSLAASRCQQRAGRSLICARGSEAAPVAASSVRESLIIDYFTGPITHALRFIPYTSASTAKENANNSSAVALAPA